MDTFLYCVYLAWALLASSVIVGIIAAVFQAFQRSDDEASAMKYLRIALFCK